MLGVVALAWFAPRPACLPLAVAIDGDPHRATRLLVFLHGRGGSLRGTRDIVDRLRAADLPRDVAVVRWEAPYSGWVGHHWGFTSEDQASSRARLREGLDDLIAGRADAEGPVRIIVAGFSQGAGVALDLAVDDPRIDRVASFSPCQSFLRGSLPHRAGLRALLSHGREDTVCPVEESRSLARVLEAAGRPVEYLETDAGHTLPDVALRALVSLATSP